MLASVALACAPVVTAAENAAAFPESVSQGALVLGKVPPGSHVRYADRDLLVTPGGDVVFGVGRDEKGPVHVDVRERDGRHDRIDITVTPPDWPVEHI